MLGHVDRISRSMIAGWAADPLHPADEVIVRIILNGETVRAVANLPRTDLMAAFPGATGRYGFQLDSDKLPLSPFIDHRVEIVFAETGTPLPGGSVSIPALGGKPPESGTVSRTPVLLTTTGRSGSSLLMGRLSRHPDIIVARGHPYEVKLLSYYSCALRTLIADADRSNSTNPDSLGAIQSRFYIGSNPFNDGQDPSTFSDFWSRIVPDQFRATFIHLIEEYYRRVGIETGKLSARFFAEKVGTVGILQQGIMFLYGRAKEIILVRDPRDIICSSKTFWHRSFSESVQTLRGEFIGLSRPRQMPGLSQHILRYEDLVQEPKAVLAAVFGFLGIDTAVSGIDERDEARVFQRHATSKSAEETIGRWRREMPADEVATATRELAPFLEHFGYPSE